jgi:serralysin
MDDDIFTGHLGEIEGLAKPSLQGWTHVDGPTSVLETDDFSLQDVRGLLEGTKWTDLNISYSYPTSKTNYDPNYPGVAANGFLPLGNQQMVVARYAFDSIEDYTPLHFDPITETSDGARLAGTHATIRLANSTDVGGKHTSYGSYPDASYGTGGDIFFENIRSLTPDRGSYAFATILHEIGHTLGLKHGHEAKDNFGVLPDDHQSTQWSIMDYHSYKGGPTIFMAGSDDNQTYMIDDISALQYLYGANFSGVSSGDSVYRWDPLTGEESISLSMGLLTLMGWAP